MRRLHSGLRQEPCAGAMRGRWVQGAELRVPLLGPAVWGCLMQLSCPCRVTVALMAWLGCRGRRATG